MGIKSVDKYPRWVYIIDKIKNRKAQGARGRKMKYYINGWREGRNYFFRLGRFTEEEIKRLEDGEIVIKGENEFYMEEA